MTYPGLTNRRQRGDAAHQFHLVRMGFTSLQKAEKTLDPDDRIRRLAHATLRQQYKAQLGSMRDLLHALFD